MRLHIISSYMTLSDDTEEFAKKLTESDEYEVRFEQLIEQGLSGGLQPDGEVGKLEPKEHLEIVVDTLTDEFIREDDNIQNQVPQYGELLEKTFERITAEKFLEEMKSRQEFLDHLEELAEELEE